MNGIDMIIAASIAAARIGSAFDIQNEAKIQSMIIMEFEKFADKPSCVTPNGRTDGHLSYVKMVEGKFVCAFCGKEE